MSGAEKSGWRDVKLEDIAEVNPGRTRPDDETADVTFLTMSDVSETGAVIRRQQRGYLEVAKGFTSFAEGDVLVAKITPCFENGKGAQATDLLNGIGFGSTEFHVIRAKPNQASARYLYWHTRSDAFRYEGEQRMVGSAGQKRVPTEFLRQYPLALPPLPEQQKIAAILTAVDDKLGVISRQISATQTLKQGLMQTLFTRGAGTPDAQGRWHPHTDFQDTELGRIPAGWTVTTLEQVANVERGKFSARPRNDPQYFEAGDIPFIQTGDIAAATRYVSKSSQFLNEDGLSVSRLFPVGTIFITIAANIGDVAMAKIPMACPDSLVGILPSSALCDGMWLYYLLKNGKEYFDSQSTQNAQKNINLQVLRPFAFGLPPLAEQAHIAGYLSSLDDKLDTLTTKQTHYQSLKRGLMQKLLTGEWRVRVDAAG